MNYVLYIRVSTTEQGESGLGLEGQREAARRYAAPSGVILAEYTDVQSGKDDDRPELQKAIAHCQQTGAVLLVAKLDRLARRAAYLMEFVERTGVEFRAVDNPDLDTVKLGIYATFAQYEREQISARTKAALAAKKAQGVQLGNPHWQESIEKAQAAGRAKRTEIARARYSENRAINCICLQREQGKSYGKIAEYLNTEGFTTNRGKRWSATQVMRAFKMCCE